MIGQVLIHAPVDHVSDLWINEDVAKILNVSKNQDMRDGFQVAIINARNVFWKSGGKQEMKLSKTYKSKAESLEDKGYIHFATTLRILSEYYKQQSEKDLENV